MASETVYRVTMPMPEIGAEVGDCLVADPSHPTHPLILTRSYARALLSTVLNDERISLIDDGSATRGIATTSHLRLED